MSKRPQYSDIMLQAEPTSKKADTMERIISFLIKNFASPIIAEKKMIKEEMVVQDMPALLIESTSEKLCSDLNADFSVFSDLWGNARYISTDEIMVEK